jgi:hypothetical protein
MINEICDRCGSAINTLAELGYMGSADRLNTECDAWVSFETVCAKCEGSSVVDEKINKGEPK